MNHDRKLCVTGATGFIGQSLCTEWLARGHSIRAAVRDQASLPHGLVDGFEMVAVGEIGATTDWLAALAGVDCVIHCAARAHVIQETAVDPMAAYRAVNVAGTRRLAEQAAALGVRRLVFLSSIGVLGIHTNGREPFSVSDVPAPVEDYAISKWEAEQALHAVAARAGLEVVIVRPPLVYGPRVKGNLARLLGLVRREIPLPLGAVNNQRSLVGLDNLVNLLVHCIDHPRAAGQTFLVSDGEDLSTPGLLWRMAAMMGKKACLLPVPVSLLRLAGRMTGKLAEVDRLVGSLQVDSSHTCEVLDWSPPVSVDEGLKKIAEWYLRQR